MVKPTVCGITRSVSVRRWVRCTAQYHVQLGLIVKGRAIKGLVVYIIYWPNLYKSCDTKYNAIDLLSI